MTAQPLGWGVLLVEPVPVSRLQAGDRIIYYGGTITITAITPADARGCRTFQWRPDDRGSNLPDDDITLVEEAIRYRVLETAGRRYHTIADIRRDLVDPLDGPPSPDELLLDTVLLDRGGALWTAAELACDPLRDNDELEELFGPWTVIWPGGPLS